MPEIALNVLDVAENSIRAEASLVEIDVEISTSDNTLTVKIIDDGKGMSEEQLARVTDPFYTSRTTRKVGLGVPFYKMAAENTGGSFTIESEVGKGTSVIAVFGLTHIDRMPLGDINGTIYMLISFNESVDFLYRYSVDGREFELDTRQLREILGDVSFREAEVSDFIKGYLAENKEEVDQGMDV